MKSPPQTVYLRGMTRDDIRTALAVTIHAMTGKGIDPTGNVQALQTIIGLEALAIVKEAYVVKARGGTDEAGESWAKLKETTIAYGRRHPGLNRKRKTAGEKGRAGRPLLTDAQDKLWRRTYGQTLQALTKGYGEAGGYSAADLKGHAAAYAWQVVKLAGGKTILGEYGGTRVEILRDMGQLLSSLSPGSGSPEQILRTEPGVVIAGTNRKGAAAHHKGSPARGLPQRRLWPEVDKWPAAWWQRIREATGEGIKQMAVAMLQRGSR